MEWRLRYRSTQATYVSHYIRARDYDSQSARWAEVDHLWPATSAYGYATGSPVLRQDATGLAPSRALRQVVVGPTLGSAPPPAASALEPGCRPRGGLLLGLELFGAGDCVQNTQKYADGCAGNGNAFACCASCVSLALCGLIASFFEASLTDLTGVAGQMYEGFKCMNNCLAQAWEAKTSTAWRNAAGTCDRSGSTSSICCAACVTAEQATLTPCMGGCGLAGAILSAWQQKERINFGQGLCCDQV